jgi:hypothetical protein
MAFEQAAHFVSSKLQVADGGSLVFNNTDQQIQAFHGYYGAFSDYTNQAIVSTTTAYIIKIGQTDEAVGVTRSNDGRLTVAHEGVYNFQWSGQFINSNSADHNAYIWLRKNGVDVVGTTGEISVPAKHGSIDGHGIYGWNFVLTLAANDYIELWWSAESTAVSIITKAAGTAPTRPSTASIVATLTQVR